MKKTKRFIHLNEVTASLQQRCKHTVIWKIKRNVVHQKPLVELLAHGNRHSFNSYAVFLMEIIVMKDKITNRFTTIIKCVDLAV